MQLSASWIPSSHPLLEAKIPNHEWWVLEYWKATHVGSCKGKLGKIWKNPKDMSQDEAPHQVPQLLLGFLLPIISWEQSQGCSWTYDNSGISDVFVAFWGHQLKIKSWVTGLFPGLATTTLGISILLHKLLGLFWKSLGPPKSQLSLGEYKNCGVTPADAAFCFLDSFVPSSPGSKNSKSWMVGSGILEGYPCWIM